MNFISVLFIIFLLSTFFVFNIVPSRLRIVVLLIASYVFYATWSIPFILVILLTTSFDYWMSKIIHQHRLSTKAKLALVSGVLINLLCLGFFKYTNFLLDSSGSLIHLFNFNITLPQHLNIILPLGISFYTFEALSYLIDVYRGQSPARNFIEYNFYIMYFPHLISGPIIRFNELFMQYRDKIALPPLERLKKGLLLIFLGFVFKVAIADQMAGFVDPVFNAAQNAKPIETWLAALGFTVQIYFDFMGYTHIARGTSLLFNLELPLNFNHPYVATSISDFWHRWHISLSRWIRDYLYVPLGGSKQNIIKTGLTLVLVMSLAGAWHGAGWPFILWGLYNGLLLAGYHFWKALLPKTIRDKLSSWPIYSALSILITFFAVVIGWVFFRAANLHVAFTILNNMFDVKGIHEEINLSIKDMNFFSIATMGYLLFLCFSGPWIVQQIKTLSVKLPYWVKGSAALVLASLTWILSVDVAVPFIYFQF